MNDVLSHAVFGEYIVAALAIATGISLAYRAVIAKMRITPRRVLARRQLEFKRRFRL